MKNLQILPVTALHSSRLTAKSPNWTYNYKDDGTFLIQSSPVIGDALSTMPLYHLRKALYISIISSHMQCLQKPTAQKALAVTWKLTSISRIIKAQNQAALIL